MGKVAVFFSRHRQSLIDEFLAIAKGIECGDIHVDFCSNTVFRRFHKLAENPVVNTFQEYHGEALLLITASSGITYYKAFDDLMLFCIRVLRYPPAYQAA